MGMPEKHYGMRCLRAFERAVLPLSNVHTIEAWCKDSREKCFTAHHSPKCGRMENTSGPQVDSKRSGARHAVGSETCKKRYGQREEQNRMLARCVLSAKMNRRIMKFAVRFHEGRGEVNEMQKRDDRTRERTTPK